MKLKTVVAVVGMPTSGKSTLTKALAKTLNVHVVDIDEGPAHCAPPQEPDPLASDESRKQERKRMAVAYTILHAAIEANLAHGFSLIITATYSRHISQNFLAKAVENGGGNLKVILCQYHDTPEEVDRRIKERLATNAIGGCRSTSHYFEDKSRYEGINLNHITNPYTHIIKILGRGFLFDIVAIMYVS